MALKKYKSKESLDNESVKKNAYKKKSARTLSGIEVCTGDRSNRKLDLNIKSYYSTLGNKDKAIDHTRKHTYDDINNNRKPLTNIHNKSKSNSLKRKFTRKSSKNILNTNNNI